MKASKLDPFKADLLKWDADRVPLTGTADCVIARLAARGCSASPSYVSDYTSRARSAAEAARVNAEREAVLLREIARAASMESSAERQFALNTPPKLQTAIHLLSVMLARVQEAALSDPGNIVRHLEPLEALLKPILEFEKLVAKKEEMALDREKFLAALKPQLDLAMDEFAAALKANPHLLAEFNEKFRPKVHAAVAK